MSAQRDRIFKELFGYGVEQGISFTSQKDAIDYWVGIVSLIERLLVQERRREMHECIECGEPIDLAAGDEISPDIGRLANDYGEVELCRRCFSQGWSPASPEDFANDPDFAVGYPSPLQRGDLGDIEEA